MNTEVDLNIKNYNFLEILDLFSIKHNHVITEQDIKKGKLLVLSMHPDKSKLSPKYFIFYKKAFECIIEFYQTQTTVRSKNLSYDNDNAPQIKKHLSKIDPKEFNLTFNKLYEENNKIKIDSQNHWFKRDDVIITSKKTSNIHENIQMVRNKNQKEKGQSNIVTKFNEFPTLDNHDGCVLHDDYENNDDAPYIYCNPSSKLIFDDIRKVHLNESIINVSIDTVCVPRDSNELRKERENDDSVLSNKDTEQIFLDRQAIVYQESIERKFKDFNNDKKWHDINEKFLAKFLHISN
jgi:hypothetical protein